MLSSSFSAHPSIERLKGTRSAPTGTSGDVISLSQVQLVPFLENREDEHAIHGDVVGTRFAQAIDQTLNGRRIEQSMPPKTLGAECLAHPRLQMSEQPRRDRHQESFLRPAHHLLGKVS